MFRLHDLDSGYSKAACFEQQDTPGAYRIDGYLLPVESADNNGDSSYQVDNFEEQIVMQQQLYQLVSGRCIALDYRRVGSLVARLGAQGGIDQLEDQEVEEQALGILDKTNNY